MDTTEQAEKQKKIKRRNIIVGVVLFGVAIIGSIGCGMDASNSATPEPGVLPCKADWAKEDWEPVQVGAGIWDARHKQCFEIEGTVEEHSDLGVFVSSDTGGHTYIIFTENMPPCVMGNIAEGSRVSASAYLLSGPASRDDGTFIMLFGCAIPEPLDAIRY